MLSDCDMLLFVPASFVVLCCRRRNITMAMVTIKINTSGTVIATISDVLS